MTSTTDTKVQGIGASVLRKEDARHLHGRGNFVSDMMMAGQQEVAFLRSPFAHGYIRSIAKPAAWAEQMFVRDDLTGLNPVVAGSTLPGYQSSEIFPLAHEKVRYAGEPVVMAFAPGRAEAEDILEEVSLDIEELPAITDALVAADESSTLIHDHWRDNTFVTLNLDSEFESRSRGAPVVVSRECSLSRQAMNPMEGKAVLAYWDYRTDQLIVYTSTQVPHVIRIGLSETLGLEESRVRVISPDVGGGFGYKCMLHTEEICVAWLAYKFRRPFRYVEDRREHLIAGANTRQHHYKLTGYADKSGRLLALDAEITIDGGAYSVWPFTIGTEPGQAIGNLPGPYDFRGYRCKTTCVATNKPGFMPYRGVARTGVCFAIELLMDEIARAVGRDPWDVRHDNLVAAELMPYVNVTKKHYDSGDYRKSLAVARENLKLDAWRARQKEPRADGRRIGIGVATYCEQSAHGTSVLAGWGLPFVPGYDQATARIAADGSVELRAGVHSHGQGMETTFAQIAHQVLEVDLKRIHVTLGDTGLTPFSTGTYASRSIVMSGGAVARACQALVSRLIHIGAHLMQCTVQSVRFENGRIVGPQSEIAIEEVADAWYRRPERLPPDVDRGGLEATVAYKPKVDTGAFSYGTHAAVVAVDPELGAIEILDYVIVEDCGTMVNPMVVDGQTLGGAAQGIGTALYEESPYDGNGQPLASTLADYLIPGAVEIPDVRIFHMVTPSPHTEFGLKGMGEGGAIAPPAVLRGAVEDALSGMGVTIGETPLTPRRVLAAIDRARSRMAAAEPARTGALQP